MFALKLDERLLRSTFPVDMHQLITLASRVVHNITRKTKFRVRVLNVSAQSTTTCSDRDLASNRAYRRQKLLAEQLAALAIAHSRALAPQLNDINDNINEI